MVTVGREANVDGAALTPELVKGIDTAIEFTTPAAAPTNITRLMALGVPTVTGTTGWLAQLSSITHTVDEHHGALLHASNFSVGVQVFLRSARQLAALMRDRPEFDAQVVETHHTRKLDSPSGTALRLTSSLHAGDPARRVPKTSITSGDIGGENAVRFRVLPSK